MEHRFVLQNITLVIFHQPQMVVLQHLLKLFKLTKVALLTHAAGKEELQANAIALELATAVATEQSALGMPVTPRAKL